MEKGKQKKFNERSIASYKRELKGVELRQGRKDPLIVLSFRDFDRNQGQSFNDWEQDEILALAVSKLHEVCNLTRLEATRQQTLVIQNTLLQISLGAQCTFKGKSV